MKMRKHRKTMYAKMRYEKAWEWGVARVSKVIFEQSQKMSMALYQVYAAVREANARGAGMNDLALYELGFAVPVCAVCNKPVDRVESVYNPDYDGKLFKVYCHGKVEQQMLDSCTVLDATQVTFGKAFDVPKLERGAP
jgi:hypothetical protein